MKKIFGILNIFIVLLFVAGFAGATTLDFENLPDAYNFYGDRENLGSYYSGVTFGPNVTVLTAGEGLAYDYFPPSSGNSVIFTYSNPNIEATFDNLVNEVSFWYSSVNVLWLEAYDLDGNFISKVSGPGILEANAFISISAAGIKSVIIHDGGNAYTVDDFTFKQVPEPASLILLGLALLGIGIIRKKKA